MNITHVVENLNRGGLERMVIELVKLQCGQGHQCSVVCLFEPGALAHELEDLGVPVIACGKRDGLDLRALARTRRAIRDRHTEVLHTHNAVAHYYAVLATVGLGVRRTVNTRHSMLFREQSHRREWLYRCALARTHVVVTVCEAARRDAVHRGMVPPRKTTVVPNGIRAAACGPGTMNGRRALLSSLGVPAQARVVGSVGRLSWVKDQAGMIRAFRRVHRQLPDTALVLVGDGEQRAALEQCAVDEGVAGAVHFLGDRNDVPRLLEEFDLFVLSSLSEGYSMALLEACAAGLPLVATDVGGNGEIVREGVTGHLVPAGNPEALSGAIMAILRAPETAAAMGKAACDWFRAEGSLDTMASRYAALYRGTAE